MSAAIEAVHHDLVQAGFLVPVAAGGADERRFLDCDLASLAENRIGDLLDPRDLDAAHRADWLARVTTETQMSLRARSEFERCYWIVDGGERAGTVSLDLGSFGAGRLRLASFYVLPPHRGRGTGRRALGRITDAAGRHRLSLRLETSWSWQRAVRFYLGLGMWIYMWKRDLTFFWSPGLPTHRIEVGERVATLDVPLGDRRVVLAQAHRDGAALTLDEPSATLEKEAGLGEAYWHATSTLSLALALHGWPLIRSAEEWERGYFADGGPPEALAYKISIWEAWDRKHGWLVETPRIPGLDYPTWDELEARWAAESAELSSIR